MRIESGLILPPLFACSIGNSDEGDETMRGLFEVMRTEGSRAMWRCNLTLMAVLLSLSVTARAQIDVNETDLHDGQTVYGLQTPGAPIPYINLEAIYLWAWGANDANYPNSSFYAYGLYTGIDLINSGAVDVNAVGGTATVVGGALVEAYGIGGTASVDNSGDVTVGTTGGTGVFDPFILANNFANTGPDTRAYGISTSGTVHNDGTILVTATGGPGTMVDVGDPDNIGYASLFVRTDAQGISAGDVDNTGAITAIASGATLVLASTGKTTRPMPLKTAAPSASWPRGMRPTAATSSPSPPAETSPPPPRRTPMPMPTPKPTASSLRATWSTAARSPQRPSQGPLPPITRPSPVPSPWASGVKPTWTPLPRPTTAAPLT